MNLRNEGEEKSLIQRLARQKLVKGEQETYWEVKPTEKPTSSKKGRHSGSTACKALGQSQSET